MDTKTEKKISALTLGKTLDTCALAAAEAYALKGNFERTIALGIAMNDFRDALTDGMLQSIKKLENTKIGFRTDNPNGYPLEVIRDCVIEASIRGLQCVGNQWNIIAGQFYATKEGFTYLLRRLPGLSGLKIKHNPAEIRENSTSGKSRDGREYTKIEREGLVRSRLEWTWNGESHSEELEHVIRVNAGMSQDAILGKADRKCRAWLYNYLTESDLNVAEDVSESGPVVDVSASTVDSSSRPQTPADLFAGDGLPGVDLNIEA